MTKQYEYDLFVIGAGSGGIRAARRAAKEGLRVGLAEAGPLGGTCVNQGCVPKKLYVYSSHYGDDSKTAEAYGWSPLQRSFELGCLAKQQGPGNSTSEWSVCPSPKGIRRRTFLCLGRLLDEHTIGLEETQDRRILDTAPRLSVSKVHAHKILIATGSIPYIPSFSGRQYVGNSDDIFIQKKLPNRLLVVGGGYIAMEFASIFTGLGVKTELVYRGELFLRRFDLSVSKFLKEEMQKKAFVSTSRLRSRRSKKQKTAPSAFF